MVRWPAAELSQLHFELELVRQCGSDNGDALWSACPSNDVKIGLAFCWAKVPPGVLVLDDHMAINSNALLTDADGHLVEAAVMQAHLTWLVYQISWQRTLEHLVR